MDLDAIDFLPALKEFDLKKRVALVTGVEKAKYTNIERSEALESLGIAQFFSGNFSEAVTNLEAAISARFIKLKSKKRLAMIKMLLGSLYFRFGDLAKSEQMFSFVADACKKAQNNAMCAAAMSNLAIVQMRQENFKDALKHSRGAMELIQRTYAKRCGEYLQAVRVVVCIYIKQEEFPKAESLVDESEFPPREKALVLAGIKFAQSEYSAACAILNKCLDTEFGQSNGFKPPTIDATVPTADVAELVANNPWNKFGASAGEGGAAVQSAVTPAVPAKSALIQPTKTPMDDVNHAVLGAMITYNLSVMKRNVKDTGLGDTIDKLEHLAKRLADRRVTINNKADRTQTINSQLSEEGIGAMSQDDPYLRLPWNKHPAFTPFDAYMYPAVTLSAVLAAQSEFDMLTTTPTSGLAIESGHVGGDVAGLEVTLRQMQQELRGVLVAVQSALPSTLVEKSSTSQLQRYQQNSWNSATSFPEEDEDEIARGHDTATPSTGSPQATSRSTGFPVGLPYEDSEFSGESTSTGFGKAALSADASAPTDLAAYQELPDIAQGNYALQRFQILKDIVSCKIGTEELASAAQRRLREEHQVYLSSETGRMLTPKEIDALLHPKPVRGGKGGRGSKRGGGPPSPTTGRLSSTGTNFTEDTEHDSGSEAVQIAAQNSILDANSRTGSRGDAMSYRSDHSDLHLGELDAPASRVGTAEGRRANELPQITYNAKKLAAGTLQAELYPLLQTFGKDQATLWIEWAISKAGAASFGFLGQSCMDPLPEVGFDLMRTRSHSSGELSEEYLTQIRSRLLELEAALSNPGENSKLTSQRGVRVEARVVNFFLLCKVTVQLGLKKEAGQCIMQLDDACQALRRLQCDSLDSAVYHALALRYRLDFEEWNMSAMVSDAWLLSHLVNKVLPLCKQYRTACNLTGDVTLQRDAVKRQINLYSQVGAVPCADESDAGALTMARVAALTPVEIDAYEQNVEWIQKNGVHRALVLFDEMTQLAEAALR